MKNREQEMYESWISSEKDKFLDQIYVHIPESEKESKDFQLIPHAFDFAAQIHKDERRDPRENDGHREYYITHPIAVSLILLLEFPRATSADIVRGLMHDTLESGAKKKDIESLFGLQISQSVDNLSKKQKVDYLRPHEHILYYTQAAIDNIFLSSFGRIISPKKELRFKNVLGAYFEEELKKRRDNHYFGGLEKLPYEDLRVKAADHIHSLRTIDNCSPEKKSRIITRGFEIFLPATQDRLPYAYKLILDELLKKAIDDMKERSHDILSTVM